MNKRVTVRVSDADITKIQNTIKSEYPELKNYSDVVRHALTEFLNGRKAT